MGENSYDRFKKMSEEGSKTSTSIRDELEISQENSSEGSAGNNTSGHTDRKSEGNIWHSFTKLLRGNPNPNENPELIRVHTPSEDLRHGGVAGVIAAREKQATSQNGDGNYQDLTQPSPDDSLLKKYRAAQQREKELLGNPPTETLPNISTERIPTQPPAEESAPVESRSQSHSSLDRQIADTRAEIQENQTYVNALDPNDEMRVRYEGSLRRLQETLLNLEVMRDAIPQEEIPSKPTRIHADEVAASQKKWEKRTLERQGRVAARKERVQQRREAAKQTKAKGAESVRKLVEGTVQLAGSAVGEIRAVPENVRTMKERVVAGVVQSIDTIDRNVAMARNTAAETFDRRIASATGTVEAAWMKVDAALLEQRAGIVQTAIDAANLLITFHLKYLENKFEHEQRQLQIIVGALGRGEADPSSLQERTDRILELNSKIQKLKEKLNTPKDFGETKADRDFIASQKVRAEGEKRKKNGRFLSGLRKRIASFIDAK